MKKSPKSPGNDKPASAKKHAGPSQDAVVQQVVKAAERQGGGAKAEQANQRYLKGKALRQQGKEAEALRELKVQTLTTPRPPT